MSYNRHVKDEVAVGSGPHSRHSERNSPGPSTVARPIARIGNGSPISARKKLIAECEELLLEQQLLEISQKFFAGLYGRKYCSNFESRLEEASISLDDLVSELFLERLPDHRVVTRISRSIVFIVLPPEIQSLKVDAPDVVPRAPQNHPRRMNAHTRNGNRNPNGSTMNSAANAAAVMAVTNSLFATSLAPPLPGTSADGFARTNAGANASLLSNQQAGSDPRFTNRSGNSFAPHGTAAGTGRPSGSSAPRGPFQQSAAMQNEIASESNWFQQPGDLSGSTGNGTSQLPTQERRVNYATDNRMLAIIGDVVRHSDHGGASLEILLEIIYADLSEKHLKVPVSVEKDFRGFVARALQDHRLDFELKDGHLYRTDLPPLPPSPPAPTIPTFSTPAPKRPPAEPKRVESETPIDAPLDGKAMRERIRNRWNPSIEEMTAAKAELQKMYKEPNYWMLDSIRRVFMQGDSKHPKTVLSMRYLEMLENSADGNIIKKFRISVQDLTVRGLCKFVNDKEVTIPDCLVNALFVRLSTSGLAYELYRVLVAQPGAVRSLDGIVENTPSNPIFTEDVAMEESQDLASTSRNNSDQQRWREATIDQRYEMISQVAIDFPKLFQLVGGRMRVRDPEQRYTTLLALP